VDLLLHAAALVGEFDGEFVHGAAD
jgi:hypothetical protein